MSKGKSRRLVAGAAESKVITSATAVPRRKRRKGSLAVQLDGGASVNSAVTAPTGSATPTEPAGGTLPCLTEREVAYSAVADDTARYYIDTGAPDHFINEVYVLHDYIPFEFPREITTAEGGTMSSYGTGTFRFATVMNDKKVTGEFQRVYYIPGIHTRLISVGKFFSLGAL